MSHGDKVHFKKKSTKKRNTALERKTRYEIWTRKKAYKEPIRGGRSPESFGRSYSVQRYAIRLQEETETQSDIFLDSNVLYGEFFYENDLREDYFRLVTYIGDRAYRENGERLIAAMRELAEFHEHFLKIPNIHIIESVRKEQETYFSSIREKAKREITSRTRRKDLLAPIEKLKKALEENSARVEDSRIEEDPVIDRVYDLLPNQSKGRSKDPSETDKRLIAVPFAMGLTDGRNKVVLSNDGAIHSSLADLSKKLSKDPKLLRLDDLGENIYQRVSDVH